LGAGINRGDCGLLSNMRFFGGKTGECEGDRFRYTGTERGVFLAFFFFLHPKPLLQFPVAW
jgi:hypothetical protein